MKTIRADEYCKFVTDGTHDSPKQVNKGRKLITSKHLGRYGIDFKGAKNISESDYQKVISRSKVEQWDILFSMIGTIGNLYLERNHKIEYACKNMGIFQLGGDESKAKWLYYYLQTPKAKEYIETSGRGTTQSYVPLAALRALPVDVVDGFTRDKIIKILWGIDEKILTNQQINKNLEQQAQAIFKSWFIDFRPFGGNRPIDWVTGIVDDLGAEIICGKTPSTKRKEYYGGNTPFITIPDMHGCVYNVSTERYLSAAGVASQPKKTLPPNTVCVSCIGTAGLVTLVSEKSQSNQQINTIVPKEGISVYYIYLLMQTLSETINKLGQSGSTIVNLNKTQFAKIPVTIPSEQVLCNFDTLCKPLFEMILSNQKENIRLTNLRDTLLPKLMSGELDVSNIEL